MFPSDVATVIVDVPAATPVTSPLELTVALLASLVDQVTLRLVALVGAIVAVSCSVAPTRILVVDLFRVTPLTETVTVVSLAVLLLLLEPAHPI